MRTAALSILLVLSMLVASTAAVPQTMSYQGVLRDAIGNPVADGDYDVTFRLYYAATGPGAIWAEAQTVSVEGGVFDAILGSVVPLTPSFTVGYWLGIAVEGEPELTPRVELTSAPYALRAAVADSLAGGGTDSDWSYSGNDIYRVDGDVGIGTSTPGTKLHVQDDFNSLVVLTIENQDEGASSGQAILLDDEENGQAWIGVYDEGHSGYPNAMVIADNRNATSHIRFHAGGTEEMRLTENGDLGIGVTTPSSRLDVDGTAEVTGFQMATGATAGHVLTSNASGVGTWQAAAGSDGDWTIAGSDMYSTVSGDVGIGNTTPTAKLDVLSTSSVEALQVVSSGAPSRMLNIERTVAPSNGNDIIQVKMPTGSPDGFQFLECEVGSAINFAVDGNGDIYSRSGAELNDALTVDVDGMRAASFTTTRATDEPHIVHAEYTGTYSGASQPIGVYSKVDSQPGIGMGGLFSGGYIGLRAVAEEVGSGYRRAIVADAWAGDYNYAVDAWASGGSTSYGILAETSGGGTGRAVRAVASGSGTNYAVSAYAYGGATNWAGYFTGNVHVNGTFSKTAGSFKIDHPLDPEGQYLQHSFVESPDMMNVYNGNVTLDGAGEAWVEMPEWFEALNRDFRYQLTCIGGFAPVYIAETIRGNTFKIAGGEAGMQVSWMVTGVRQDPYAEQNRIEVELQKSPEDFGKYVSPEAYGRTAEDGIGYVEPREREHGVASSGTAPARRPVRTTEDE